jgi:hypothetical protein
MTRAFGCSHLLIVRSGVGEYEAKKPLSGYPVTNSGFLAFYDLTKHTLSLPIFHQNNPL